MASVRSLLSLFSLILLLLFPTAIFARENQNGGSASPHIVSHYSFFKGEPKWHKSQLVYGFNPGEKENVKKSFAEAFTDWSSASHHHLTFSRAPRNKFSSADIKILFQRGDHGDGIPFKPYDIAHAFPPPDGRLHLNVDQQWSEHIEPGKFHLKTVALHEIGHLLGMNHSSLPQAIMYPYIEPGEGRNLHEDDIEGIRALYK